MSVGDKVATVKPKKATRSKTVTKKIATPKKPTAKKKVVKKKALIPVRNLSVPKKAEVKPPVDPFYLPIEAEPEVEERLAEIKTELTKEPEIKKIELKSAKYNIPESLPELEPVGVIKKPRLYKRISVFFLLLTLVLVAVVFYVAYAKVEIVLTPREERLSDNLTFDVLDQNWEGQASEDGGQVAGLVEKLSFSQTKNYPASGAEAIGEEVLGQVTLYNNSVKNQPLVATTRLMSADGKLFRLKNTVNIPAGGKIEAEVYADEPSAEMAIAPTRFTIPGLWSGLQDKIYAESSIQFVYAAKNKHYIKQEDVDLALADLKKILLEQAEKEYGENYKGYNGVVYNLDETSIDINMTGKVGEEKSSFDATIKADIVVVGFPKEKIAQASADKLNTVIPDNKELLDFDKQAITYMLNSFDLEKGQANVTATFEGKMSLKKSGEVLDRGKILGLNEQQLNTYLQGFKEFSGYEIHFTPSFIHSVPKLVDRVEVRVK